AAMEKKVLMASPLTLMGLLRVVAFGWRQAQLAEGAKEVSNVGADLYKRIQVFANHFQKVGRGLGTALGAYNDAVGSLERNVLSSTRKLKDLHVVDQTAEDVQI